MEINFNIDRTKEAQEAIFSRKAKTTTSCSLSF